jgi:prevent-host-death family protein
MAEIKVSDGIVPMADFKAHMSRYFRALGAEQRPLVVTQNGRPAAVVLSPRAFDELTYWREYRASIDEALLEAKEGRFVPHERVEAWISSWGTDHELPRPEPQ